MAHEVFISYARRTAAEHAHAIRHRLRERGIASFVDVSNIEIGEVFTATLATAILDARVVVVVADEMYFTRWYCLRELRTALGPYDEVMRRPSREAAELDKALRSLVVLRVGESLDALPQRLALSNWPAPDDIDRLVALVEERISIGIPTIRAQLEATHALELLHSFHESAALPPPTHSAAIVRYKHVPLDLSLGERFVGRAGDVERMHRAVYPRERPGAPDAASAARIVAADGFGKTRLLVEYIWRFGHYYPEGVFWIDARSSASSPEEQLYEILKRLRPDTPDLLTLRRQQDDVRALLEGACRQDARVGRSLFVVDDVPADSPPLELRRYCPAVGLATVIATSPQTTREPGVIVLELDHLHDDSAIVLLTHELNTSRALSVAEWGELAKWVGCMPLALEQMHWALADGAIAPASLLQLARDAQSATAQLDELSEVLRGQVPDSLLPSISSLFAASYGALDAETRAAASVLAQFAPVALPEQVVDALGVELVTRRARLQLRTRHFVSAAAEGVFGSMHTLMNDFIVRASGASEGSWMRACDALLRVLDPQLFAQPDSWRLMSLCEPHAAHMFRSGTRDGEVFENTVKQERAIELGLRASDLLRARGDIVQSDKLLTPVAGKSVMLLSDPQLELRVWYSYCRTREELGHWDDVLTHLHIVFMIGQNVVGMDHPLVLAAKRMQARVLLAQGDYRGTAQVFKELFSARNAYHSVGMEFPIDDIALAEEMGGFSARINDFGKAAELYLRALTGYERREPAESQNVLRTKANYAQALSKLGGGDNLSCAKELLTTVREVQVRKYGAHHRGTIIVTSNLASVLLGLGESAAAIALLLDALDNARPALGEDHHDTLHIRRKLGAAYLETHDNVNARTLLQEVAATEQRLGLSDLAMTKFLLAKLDEEGA